VIGFVTVLVSVEVAVTVAPLMTLTTLMMVISMLISTPMMMLVTGVSHTSWLLVKVMGTQSAIEATGTV